MTEQTPDHPTDATAPAAPPPTPKSISVPVNFAPNGQVAQSAIPFSYAVGNASTESGGRLIMLQIHKPNGVDVHFMDPEFAKKIADSLNEAAGGLTVARATPGLIVPPGT